MAERRRLTTFVIDPDLKAALEALKVRDGIPESESIRRALRAWLQEKGVLTAPRAAAKGKKR